MKEEEDIHGVVAKGGHAQEGMETQIGHHKE